MTDKAEGLLRPIFQREEKLFATCGSLFLGFANIVEEVIGARSNICKFDLAEVGHKFVLVGPFVAQMHAHALTDLLLGDNWGLDVRNGRKPDSGRLQRSEERRDQHDLRNGLRVQELGARRGRLQTSSLCQLCVFVHGLAVRTSWQCRHTGTCFAFFDSCLRVHCRNKQSITMELLLLVGCCFFFLFKKKNGSPSFFFCLLVRCLTVVSGLAMANKMDNLLLTAWCQLGNGARWDFLADDLNVRVIHDVV